MGIALPPRKLNHTQIIKVAELLKTIGHPVRLEIMEILETQEPLCVSEIQQRLETPVEQSLLSHHLIKMKDKGVLSCEKDGMHMRYRLQDRSILHIFDCMESCNMVK
ncbi:MAG: helix-turn-helix transcriptional regulator [Bacteroidetes bacterium]|nr:helix-turn-helix transcriptional regulator [Bacteroidota bacterium]